MDFNQNPGTPISVAVTPSLDADIGIIRLKSISVQSVAKQLDALFKGVPDFTLAYDQRNNAVLVRATENLRQQVAAVLQALDTEEAENAFPSPDASVDGRVDQAKANLARLRRARARAFGFRVSERGGAGKGVANFGGSSGLGDDTSVDNKGVANFGGSSGLGDDTSVDKQRRRQLRGLNWPG